MEHPLRLIEIGFVKYVFSKHQLIEFNIATIGSEWVYTELSMQVIGRAASYFGYLWIADEAHSHNCLTLLLTMGNRFM